ncbi:TPA: hypothetical protein JAW44_003825, partial [Citrobacter werkmanii]|nr:hypothetical protein [Citrobacter werkmanii]
TTRHSGAGFQFGQSYSPTGNIVEQWAGHHESGTTDWPMDIWRRQEYDRAWNLTRVSDNRWGTTTYRYDTNDQITLAEGGTRQLPRQEHFGYDVNLNIRHHGQTRNLPDALMQFTAQEQEHGRVTKRGDSRFRYDEGGRLVEKTVLSDGFRPQRWRYRWDGMGQLVQLITPQGERWRYTYDAFGRRLSKRRERTTLGIAGYDYQWSGDLLVAETPVYADGTAAVEHSVYWLYEPGALTPGARYENGQLHYVVRDHMGTPRELLTETGEVVRAQKLSVWGKAEQYRFGGLSAANDDDTAPHCPWRFAGQYADEESGLHYNRFRYYDVETGQYVSPDPIGLDGGLNPYGYVNNPLKYIDPLGLDKVLTDGVVYRMGSGTDSNLTPRPGKDTTTGLSTTIEKPTGKYQELDVKKLRERGLIVVQDGKNHASIRPADDPDFSKLREWANTRGTDNKSLYTIAVQEASCGKVGT